MTDTLTITLINIVDIKMHMFKFAFGDIGIFRLDYSKGLTKLLQWPSDSTCIFVFRDVSTFAEPHGKFIFGSFDSLTAVFTNYQETSNGE